MKILGLYLGKHSQVVLEEGFSRSKNSICSLPNPWSPESTKVNYTGTQKTLFVPYTFPSASSLEEPESVSQVENRKARWNKETDDYIFPKTKADILTPKYFIVYFLKTRALFSMTLQDQKQDIILKPYYYLI